MGRAYVSFASAHPARFQATFGLSFDCAARRQAQGEANSEETNAEHRNSCPSEWFYSALDDLRKAGVMES